MTFNELVASNLQAAKLAHGLTNQEMAERLGLEKGNFISMLMAPKGRQSPMSVKLVRRMCVAFGLSAREGAKLLYLRAKNHPDAATALDVDTLIWSVKTFNSAAKEGGCHVDAEKEVAADGV